MSNLAPIVCTQCDHILALCECPPRTGHTIIDAVIRTAAIEKAVPHSDGGFIFVWAANAAEQIEAALAEAGLELVRKV